MDDIIDYRRLLVRMARYRFVLLAVPAACMAVAFAVALSSPPRYTALARLLPPRTNSATASALLNQIGGTETIGASAVSLKSPSELYASLFLSRSVQDRIIAGFDLAERYGESDIDALRQAVESRTRVDVREDGIIELRYQDSSGQQAADIVNAMIRAVHQKSRELLRSESENRLAFYDQIIAETRIRLQAAERTLLTLENRTGYLRLRGQEEITATTGGLESLLLAKETQLSRMLASTTEAHPTVRRIRAEIDALRRKRAAIGETPVDADADADAGAADAERAPGGTLLPVARFAELQSRIEPARREVETYRSTLESLIRARQFSRIDENRDLSNMQTLDAATPPTRQSGPRLARNTLLAGAISALLTLMAWLVWDTLWRRPAHRRTLRRLRAVYFRAPALRRPARRRRRDA